MNEFFLKLGRIPARNYLVWLAVLAAVWIGCGVWTNGVASGDETRVAGISAEMVFRGDWLVPRLNGEPFLEYPPLFYWLQAIGFSLFGINDFAAAVPAALAAFGGVLTLFALGRRLGFSGIGAFLSCVLLLTCAQYLSNARSCRVDMLLAFAVLLAVYGFYAMLTERNGAKRFGFWCVGTAGLAAGILTKGLVGAALPAVALGGFLVLRDILERKFRWKNYLAMAAGGAVSLVPVGIWLWPARRTGSFRYGGFHQQSRTFLRQSGRSSRAGLRIFAPFARTVPAMAGAAARRHLAACSAVPA